MTDHPEESPEIFDLGADDDEDAEPNLVHEPARPCRPDIFSERIFVEAWQRYLSASVSNLYSDRIVAVLDYVWRPITQRDATVCASMFSWFGTNCGRGFLFSASTAARKEENKSDAYWWAWTKENCRHSWLNGGVRTLEHIVSDGTKKWAELSGRDLEVADCVARFLGEPDGQALIAEAEREIALVQRYMNERDSLAHRARLRALGLMKETPA